MSTHILLNSLYIVIIQVDSLIPGFLLEELHILTESKFDFVILPTCLSTLRKSKSYLDQFSKT